MCYYLRLVVFATLVIAYPSCIVFFILAEIYSFWLYLLSIVFLGGWTLIGRFIMKDENSVEDEVKTSNSYREILSNYHSNNQYLLRDGFNQLKNDMGFTQLRFYCFKKKRGRVFHIMTDKEDLKVVRFFTTTDIIPKACNTFARLADDNSTLAVSCNKWGYPDHNRWGHKLFLTNDRLFSRPLAWRNTRIYRFIGDSPYTCDDKDEAMTLGDTWKIFVR